MDKKSNFYKYRVLKFIELLFFTLMEIAFIVVLTTDKVMRNSIFSNKRLFTLCAILYTLMAAVFIFLIVDFFHTKKLNIDYMNLQTLVYTDAGTGLPNRNSCDLLFEEYNSRPSLEGVGCAVTQISNLPTINARDGKASGDNAIAEFTEILERVGKQFGFVARNGGNDFITVIDSCSTVKMELFFETLANEIKERNGQSESTPIEIRYEYVLNQEIHAKNFSELVSIAYHRLRG